VVAGLLRVGRPLRRARQRLPTFEPSTWSGARWSHDAGRGAVPGAAAPLVGWATAAAGAIASGDAGDDHWLNLLAWNITPPGR
jgi:hypothetical protein